MEAEKRERIENVNEGANDYELLCVAVGDLENVVEARSDVVNVEIGDARLARPFVAFCHVRRPHPAAEHVGVEQIGEFVV